MEKEAIGKNILINLKRVEKIDAESQRIIKDFEKQTGKPLKGSTGFVLSMHKVPVMGSTGYCQCKCSSTSDCGGGGGGS
ncbi:MAG: hypothetical protein O8C66_12115 [Candidatus Methanoperedens sp.]|nr:hypothetical protein [Candidatus Methanoperedens sp.]MCZ7371246.1 hypothetical protein [Candidatus Methanoperedens sp.]